jgi:cell wall-associated NlpC family hydrolase
MISILAVATVCLGTVALPSRPATASSLATDKAKAAAILSQINRINARVEGFGQRYDAAKIKLDNVNNKIRNTKTTVTNIERSVAKGNVQLRSDAIFAYVTNGSAAANNPLFASNASNVGATNVYNQLAEGNVSTTLASLKNYKIELTQERSILRGEVAQAADATRAAAGSYHSAKVLQASLKNTLGQVKGQIATFIAQAQAATAAQDATTLQTAQPTAGFPAPPPDSKANIAVRAALSYVGVWYQWGGASRSGVDCSGLVMLAYDAAGIYLPHYSGAQYADTMRVPLVNIQPGDLLFYGSNGDEHVAMYVGGGMMVEAEMTGTQVHVVPVRLGYGFAGLGRPRA